jgi:type II secretory pathway component PulF
MPIELASAAGSQSRAWVSGSARQRAIANRLTQRPAPRPGVRERMFFTERLELLLETGIPLHECLRALESQPGAAGLRAAIAELRAAVESGAAFSVAIRQQAGVFPPTYASLVAAGEQGGFLPAVLRRLREADQRREELRATLVSAFSYPAFLTLFSACVVVFVLVVVFPKFEDLFGMIRDQLPWTTRFLLAISWFLRAHWGGITCTALALAALLWRSARAPAGAQLIDRWFLRTPGLRGLAVRYQLLQFLNALAPALENGVPIVDALRAARESVAGASFRDWIESLERRVSEGKGFASGFAELKALPPLVPQMMATAEASGSLARVSARIAEFYERELRQQLAFLSKIAEPAMLLVMGVVVGLIVSSLLLPIFKLSTAVR